MRFCAVLGIWIGKDVLYWSSEEIMSGSSLCQYFLLWHHLDPSVKKIMWLKTCVLPVSFCLLWSSLLQVPWQKLFNFMVDRIIFLMHFKDSGVWIFLLLFFCCCFLVGERRQIGSITHRKEYACFPQVCVWPLHYLTLTVNPETEGEFFHWQQDKT